MAVCSLSLDGRRDTGGRKSGFRGGSISESRGVCFWRDRFHGCYLARREGLSVAPVSTVSGSSFCKALCCWQSPSKRLCTSRPSSFEFRKVQSTGCISAVLNSRGVHDARMHYATSNDSGCHRRNSGGKLLEVGEWKSRSLALVKPEAGADSGIAAYRRNIL